MAAGLSVPGAKTLVIDLDSQGNLTSTLGGDPSHKGAFELLTGEYRKPKDVLQVFDQWDIIAGGEYLAAADLLLTDQGKEYLLKNALEQFKGDYLYCIIDTPASLGILTINALIAAVDCVITVSADTYSLHGLPALYRTIETVRRTTGRECPTIDGILITRYAGRANIDKAKLEDFQQAAEIMKTRVYAEPIREAAAVREAAEAQQDIFSYAPRSKAAKSYRAFLEQFETGN